MLFISVFTFLFYFTFREGRAYVCLLGLRHSSACICGLRISLCCADIRSDFSRTRRVEYGGISLIKRGYVSGGKVAKS